MNTTQNRADVHAQFLRAAVAQIRKVALESCFCIRCKESRDNALESIETVAEELEGVAVEPSVPTGDLTDADNATIMRGLEHVARYHDRETSKDPSRRQLHEVYGGVCREGAGRIKALVDLTWDRA